MALEDVIRLDKSAIMLVPWRIRFFVERAGMIPGALMSGVSFRDVDLSCVLVQKLGGCPGAIRPKNWNQPARFLISLLYGGSSDQTEFMTATRSRQILWLVLWNMNGSFSIS